MDVCLHHPTRRDEPSTYLHVHIVMCVDVHSTTTGFYYVKLGSSNSRGGGGGGGQSNHIGTVTSLCSMSTHCMPCSVGRRIYVIVIT